MIQRIDLLNGNYKHMIIDATFILPRILSPPPENSWPQALRPKAGVFLPMQDIRTRYETIHS